MQIKNKKEITISPSGGTPVVVRKGNIAKWSGNQATIVTNLTASNYTQIGSSLKLTSTGRPVRIRAQVTTQIYDGVTQQTGAVQGFVGVKRVDVPGNYMTDSYVYFTDILQKIFNGGNINDYVGSQQPGTLDFTDPNPTVDGQVYEYYLVVNCGFFVAVTPSTLKEAVTVLSFELEEVD